MMPLNWWRRIVSPRDQGVSRAKASGCSTAPSRYRPGFDMLEDRITPAAAFGPPQTALTLLGQGNPTCVVAGDFNGDGRGDIVVANNNAILNVLLGRGDGTFAPSI